MLDKNDFTLFNENDFNNIIGEQLSVVLEDRGINGYPEYFITYVSLQIANHIREYTSLNIYKEYNEENPEDYKLLLALSKYSIPEKIIGRKYSYSDVLSLNGVHYKVATTLTDGHYLITNNDLILGRVNPQNLTIEFTNGDKFNYIVDDNGTWIITIDAHTGYMYDISLTKEQITAIKLACVYQADYIIDNGSTERMTAMGMINRSNKYNKKDLHEFEICSMSHTLLSTAGLLYAGIGGGVYAKVK